MPMRLTFGAVLLLSCHTLLTVTPMALPGHDQRSLLSDLEGVALFGEAVLSIVQNDAPSHRTDIPSGGTPSFATDTPIHHAEGTTADVSNP
eukprot:scaffold45058_cov39-Attheya_sp.AAC.1